MTEGGDIMIKRVRMGWSHLALDLNYKGVGESRLNPFTPKLKNSVHSPEPFKEKFVSELVRIGRIIIFYLSKLWKAKFFSCVM